MTTSSASTETRGVAAQVLTKAGWLTGRFHLAPGQALLDFLDRAEEFVSMTDVSHTSGSRLIPFFALQRRSMLVVVPDRHASGLAEVPGAAKTQATAISCLFDQGFLHGQLELAPGMRVSDYLRRHPGFLVFRDCQLMLHPRQGDAGVDYRLALALVNASRIIGVSQTDQLF